MKILVPIRLFNLLSKVEILSRIHLRLTPTSFVSGFPLMLFQVSNRQCSCKVLSRERVEMWIFHINLKILIA